jgi:hypothetical protein
LESQIYKLAVLSKTKDNEMLYMNITIRVDIPRRPKANAQGCCIDSPIVIQGGKEVVTKTRQ